MIFQNNQHHRPNLEIPAIVLKRAWQIILLLLLMALIVSPTAAAPNRDITQSRVAIAPLLAFAPEPVTPLFVDGQAQPVFGGSSTWINEELWVETEVDSDFDGKLDRIHVDVTRVQETMTEGLKVPVIMEVSPYYGGTVNVVNWNVDHEIGFPPETREVRSPNFRNTSPTISTTFESFWVPRGFAVMHVEGLGSGLSDGCTTSGGRNETLGPKAVIDWLNGRARGFTSRAGDTQIFVDWHNGKAALIGTSYNGTLPIGVATTGVDGLAAIVPISAISSWYDYYRANGMVRAPGGFQGEDLDVLAEYTYSRPDDQQICRPVIADLVANQDRVTGDYSSFWDERNYMNDVDKVKAAVIVAHGNNDWNVMTKNAAEFYSAIRALGVPHQLYWHQGGHGGAPPNTILNWWFTRYLWGVENGVESMPTAWIVRESATCPPRETTVVGDQSNTSMLIVANTSPFTLGFTLTIPQLNANGTTTNTTRTIIQIPDSTHLVLSSAVATAVGQKVADGATVYLACSSANPSPYPEWPDPDTATAILYLGPGAPEIGTLSFRTPANVAESLIDDATLSESSLYNATSSVNRLAFRTEPLSTPIRISGTINITIRAAFSKPKANVTALLVHYPSGGGNGTVISRGWIDPENPNSPSITEPMTPGEFRTLHFDMQPKDSIVPAGRRLGVVLLSSDQSYTIRPAPGTEMTIDLSASSVELPIVGGAKALGTAIGVTAPTISYTLDPANPTGQNGWYTSDVSLAWQTTDGGAALTKIGCDDEIFSVDGQYSRSCTVNNVVGTAGPVSVTVMRDATPPVLEPSVWPNPVVLGESATATPNASDLVSGIDTQSCETPDTSSVGLKTVDCTSTDMAGNTALVSAPYNVIYNWSGYFSPVDNLALNITNAGGAIPVKFSLSGDQGLHIFAPDSPMSETIDCDTGNLIVGSAETDGAGKSSLTYDGSVDQYVYVWKTDKAWVGTCRRLDVTLVDGTIHTANFSFLK